MQPRIRRIDQSGFSLIELLTVVAIIGAMVTVAMPFFKVSPMQKVDSSARQLARDLDLARTRGMATRKQVRMVFDPSSQSYAGYLDDDDDGTINETSQELQALQLLGVRKLPSDVQFGQGSASPMTGDASGVPTTFTNNKLEFAGTGVTDPFGTRGTIYLVHRDDPTAVAAVSVTGSASFKAWKYRGGWQ